MALNGRHLTRAVEVRDASEVGAARREAFSLVEGNGFSVSQEGKLGIVVTELATNLSRHAGAAGGRLLLRLHDHGGERALDVLSLDRGPGLTNVERAMRDGFSTGSTPGTGLGAVRRLASIFDVHSHPKLGTAIFARIAASDSKAAAANGTDIGAVCLPVAGETKCGDAWIVEENEGRLHVMVADGLGHGPLAAEASEEAIRVFQTAVERDPMRSMERVHNALKKTRGAAVGIVEMHPGGREAVFCGVGNIAGFLFDGARRQGLASVNGTAGHVLRRLQEFRYQAEARTALILHSDGINSRWSFDGDYAGLASHHPALVAGVLFRDFSRERDDVTVVVARRRENR